MSSSFLREINVVNVQAAEKEEILPTGVKLYKKTATITIPDSVTSIDFWAFYGCDISAEIFVKSGSYAETYMRREGFTNIKYY